MIAMNLAKGDAFVIDNKSYEFTRRLPGGRIEMEHIDSGEREQLTDDELAEQVGNGVAVLRPNAMRDHKEIEVRRMDFGSLDETIKDEARRKHRYLKLLREKGFTKFSCDEVESALEDIAKEVGDTKPPSYSVICKWRKKAGPELDIRNLIDKRHFKEGQLQLHPKVREIIGEKISEHYMRMVKPTIRDTYDMVCAEIDDTNLTRDDDDQLSKPSYHAVRDAIHRIDEYSLVASRFGKEAAEARFAPVGQGPVATHPLAVAELDHTKLDVMVVDGNNHLPLGRPWVVFLIDRRTRMPLGFHVSFDPPSVQTVAQCLKNAFLPKSYVKEAYPEIKNEWRCYGVPTWIVFDRAMENLGKDLEDMAAVLGFHVEFCPRKKPHYKGRVERFLGTMNKQLAQKIPGTTFSNIAERGDYNPVKNAVVTFDELLELIHHWIIDDYSRSPHRGISDLPSKVWAREIVHHPIRPLPDVADLDACLGRVEERVLSKKGIEFENLFFMRADVVSWRYDSQIKKLTEFSKTGPKVKIKYDPTDMTKIWVLDPRNNQYVEVPCTDQVYTEGLTLWQHRAIKTYLRNELEQNVDMTGLQQARAELQAKINDIMNLRKGKRRTSTTAKAARLAGIGTVAPAGDTSPAKNDSSNAKLDKGNSGDDKPGCSIKPSKTDTKTSPVDVPPPFASDNIDLDNE